MKVIGLHPRAMYIVVVDFLQKGQNRWKFCDGRWSPAGKAEQAPNVYTYIHPRAPNYGAFWMNEAVDFADAKISNKDHKNIAKMEDKERTVGSRSVQC